MPPLPPSPSLPLSPASVRPELLVLSSLPALHALKRPQLVMLCKEWGIKAVGKNCDIVDKLFAHGQLLASGELHEAGTDEDELEQDRMDVEMEIDDNMQVAVETEAEEMDDGGDANESSGVMVEYPDLDMQHEDLVQFGAVSNQVNFPQSISSSSIASTVRSTGTALRKRIDSIRSTISSIPASTSTAVADLVSQSDQQPQQTPVPAPPRAPMFVFGQSTATQSTATITKSEFDFSVAASNNTEMRELTAAEQVMKEMNERMMASRGPGGSKERDSSTTGENGEAKKREKEGPSPNKSFGRSFEGKHKRVFEQMDSISTHYAANRRPLAPLPTSTSTSTFSFGISHSSSRRHLPTSTSTIALHHSQFESPAKRIKLLPPIPRATLSPAKPRPLSSAPSTSALHRSSKLVSALREDGWSSAPSAASASGTGAPHVAFGSSVSTFRTKGVMREGLNPDSEEAERLKQSERDERKRKLELVKARRVSGAAAAAGRGRRSLVVGPQKSSLLAKPRTFLKTVVKKLVPNHPPPSTNATATTAPIPIISRPISKAPPSSATLPNRFKPAPNASTNMTGSTSTTDLSATAAPAGPSWKKFDLQKSLATPLGYTPKIVPKSTLLSASATSTSLSSAPSFSFGSLSVKSNTVSKPKRPLRRRPSARVANQGLLGKVGVSTTVAVTVEESDDRIAGVAPSRGKVDALGGDAEGLVAAGSIFKSPAASLDAVGQSSRRTQPFVDVSNQVGATGSGSGAVKGVVGVDENGEEVDGIRVV